MTKPDVHIRKATENDIEAICELLVEIDALHQSFDRIQIRQGVPQRANIAHIAHGLTDEQTIVLAATIDAQVAGFTRLTINVTKGNRLFVPMTIAVMHELVVKEHTRGCGAGTALMLKAREAAIARGAQRIQLDYYADNEAARSFYAHHGFVPLRHTSVCNLSGSSHGNHGDPD